MKLEQIIKLIDAGYTKAEIDKMTADDVQPVVDTKPEPEPEAKPEPQPDPVMEELKALRDQVTKMNLAQGAAAIPDEEDLMKKALAKLIGG